jgi:macrolide transport system ATP-binding/permease protein
VSGRGRVVYRNRNWNTAVLGAGTSYASMRNSRPDIGRFFNDQELFSRSLVAVIGLTVARELFGDENPVGETIKINRINFRVIGILPEKGASTFRDQDDIIVIPITTAMFRLLGKTYVDYIDIEVDNPEDMTAAQATITRRSSSATRYRRRSSRTPSRSAISPRSRRRWPNPARP